MYLVFRFSFKSLLARRHYTFTVKLTWLKGNFLLSLMLGNLESPSPAQAYQEETWDFWGLVCLELKWKAFVLQWEKSSGLYNIKFNSITNFNSSKVTCHGIKWIWGKKLKCLTWEWFTFILLRLNSVGSPHWIALISVIYRQSKREHLRLQFLHTLWRRIY